MQVDQDTQTEQMASVLAMYSAAMESCDKPTEAQSMTLSCMLIQSSIDRLRKKAGKPGALQVLACMRAELDNMEQDVFGNPKE